MYNYVSHTYGGGVSPYKNERNPPKETQPRPAYQHMPASGKESTRTEPLTKPITDPGKVGLQLLFKFPRTYLYSNFFSNSAPLLFMTPPLYAIVCVSCY